MARRWKEWPGKKSTEAALFRPRVEKAWCSVATAWWLMERVNVDVAVPGMALGDIQGGERLAGSWDGLPLGEGDVRNGVILARRLDRTFHVRLEEGFVHEGHPDDCDDGTCLAERVMDS